MAAQVTIVESVDNETDASTLSLYGNTAGFSLDKNGWIPGVGRDDDEFVTEALTLIAEGSSHDDLASKVQSLENYIYQVGRYIQDPTDTNAIWLRDQLTNETSSRQALILEATTEPNHSLHTPPADPGNMIRQYTLALKRTPFWEETTATTFEGGTSGIEVTGAIVDYTTGVGDVVGDIPARPYQFRIEQDVGGPLYEAWVGFRSAEMGDLTKFVPVWEAEDGTLGTDATIDTTSETTTASPGGGSGAYVNVSFATATMATRLTVKLGDVIAAAADASDNRGLYTVLVRAKVGAGTTARVRMLTGHSLGNNWQYRSRVEITSTDWFLYELGTFSIPIGYKFIVSDVNASQSAIRLQAERTAGSNSLMIDCFILIPHGEGGIYMIANGPTTPANVEKFVAYTRPQGMTLGYASDSSNNVLCDMTVITRGPWGWALPLGDGRLVFAAQRETAHVLADRLIYRLNAFQRWRMLRGSED